MKKELFENTVGNTKMLTRIGWILIFFGAIPLIGGMSGLIYGMMSDSSGIVGVSVWVICSSFFNLIFGEIVREFGIGLTDIESIRKISNNEFNLSYNAYSNIQTILTDMLKVMKSMDSNQATIGNYSCEQLSAISQSINK